MRARREPPPPSLALVVHHHTTPRTYIFPRGSPTFATITPVAAAFVRATHARRPSCRVHAEDGSRDSFFERVRIFVSPSRASQPFDISTLVQQSGAVPFLSHLLFERETQLLWLRVLSERDRRRAILFSARGCARVTGHVCHVG